MTKEEVDLIIAEQNKNTEEILKVLAKVKSYCQKLCNLKDDLEKENAALKDEVELWKKASENNSFKAFQFEKENEELKSKICLFIDCEKARKNGELCLGYSDDEDEPCERCKNCIKCECGYYQLGETEKDDQFNKSKELLKKIYNFEEGIETDFSKFSLVKWSIETRDFLKDSEVEK